MNNLINYFLLLSTLTTSIYCYCDAIHSCEEPYSCVNYICMIKCSKTKECPVGQICVDNICVGCRNFPRKCPGNRGCVNDQCVLKDIYCNRTTCTNNQKCVDGKCKTIKDYCDYNGECTGLETCENSRCKKQYTDQFIASILFGVFCTIITFTIYFLLVIRARKLQLNPHNLSVSHEVLVTGENRPPSYSEAIAMSSSNNNPRPRTPPPSYTAVI